MNTKTTRIEIDKVRAHQSKWLAQKLVEALDEIDRLRGAGERCGLAYSHGFECTISRTTKV